MRKLWFFIFLSWAATPLFAQQFEVKVNMDGVPTNMAYVLVNDKAVGMTDNEGILRIDPATLNPGDRITASYIGTSSHVVTYSPELAKAGSCTITLTPEFSLDEVVISGEVNGWEIFQKYTHIPILYEKKHDTKLDFVFTCRLPEQEERTITGHALLNRQNSNLNQWNYEQYDQNLIIQTRDDTTGFKRQLLTNLYFTLQVANGAIFRLGVESLRIPDSFQFGTQHGRILFSFEHKGIENDQRIFLITNEEYEFGSSRPLRYLFRVDNRSKNILSSESIHVLPQSLFNQRTGATYELYHLRYLKPKTAELESVNPDTDEFYLFSVSNIRYNSFNRKERQLFYPKEEVKAEKKAERETKRDIRRKKQQQQDLIPLFY